MLKDLINGMPFWKKKEELAKKVEELKKQVKELEGNANNSKKVAYLKKVIYKWEKELRHFSLKNLQDRIKEHEKAIEETK